MRLEELFKRAQKGGNPPDRGCYDRRETFVYMDVTSSEYRKQAAKHSRKRR